MTTLYHSPLHGGVSLPVGFQLIAKREHYLDSETQQEKRRSPISKNMYYQRLLQACMENNINLRYVLNDVWYAAAENMMFARHTLKKYFAMPLKRNRKVALSKTEKGRGKYQSLDTVTVQEHTTRKIYLDGVDFPLLLAKQVFVNGDRSVGVLYLFTSHTTPSYEQITTLYRIRWHVEEYYKSLKQNASLEKSPTRTLATHTTHFFAALCDYIKLEMLKVSTKQNHAALKLTILCRLLKLPMSNYVLWNLLHSPKIQCLRNMS